MSRGRCSALALMLCAASALVAQPISRTWPPVVAYSLSLLNNDLVYKELKLDEAQSKKAAELGQNASPRLMAVINAGKKGDELAKEVEKDLAFLKPEQRKRLMELTWQRLENIPAGPWVIGGDEAGSAPLKLTKKQREELSGISGGAGALAKLLTAEQKKVFETLKGKPAAPEIVQFRGPLGRPSGVPTVLQYLADKAVAAELKLAKEQKDKFDALAKKWRDKGYTSSATSKEQEKEARDLADAIEKDARAVLTKEQAQRLAEIMLQAAKRNLGRERDVFTLPAVAEGLKLSDDQKKKLAAIVEGRQKGLLPLFVAEGEAKDLLDAVKKYNADTHKQALAVLTAEQKTALDGLFGKTFEGQVQVSSFLPTFFEGFARPRTPLHLFLSARNYVGSAELHKELGLKADQGKKLADLAGKRLSTLGADEKKLAELAAETEKELAGILKPEQMKRLAEVMLQQYQRGARPFARASLGRFVEVRKGLELTEDQIKKLGAGGFPLAALDSVLTDAQKAKWKEMLGKATEVRLVPGGGGPGGFGGGNLPAEIVLLNAKGVAEDLKFSADQKEKLAGIVKTFQEATATGPGGPGTFQEFIKKLNAARQAASAEVAKLLDEGQKKRLGELQLQQAKQAGLYTLLMSPVAAEGLKLTSEQRKRLAEISGGRSELTSALSREFPRNRPDAETPAEVVKAGAAIQESGDKKLEAVLTKEQRETLPRLLGQPFKGVLPNARFGGVGGPGGGGLGGGGGFGLPPG